MLQFFAISFILFTSISVGAQTTSPKVLLHYDLTSEPQIECIAILTDTGFADPHNFIDESPIISDTENSYNYYSSLKQFYKAFLPRGAKVLTMDAGAVLDSLIISEEYIDSVLAWPLIGAGVKASKITKKKSGLAVTPAFKIKSDDYGKSALSKKEKDDILAFAKAQYKKNPARALAKHTQLSSCFKSQIEPSGVERIFATFQIPTQEGDGYGMLLICTKKQQGFSSELIDIYYGKEDAAEIPSLIDIIDLDQDGTAELVTQFGYYEDNDYKIYKKVGNTWKIVYRGGGSGM